MESKQLTVLEPCAERQVPAITEDFNDMFCNESKFAHFFQVAQVLASSPIVPVNFKNNPGSCLIALSLARRMNIDPLMLMQKLYLIGNKPAIEAQLAIALINACGKYSPLEYVYEGSGETRSCYAVATRKADGKVLIGTKVSMEMARLEGWSVKGGSKWISMPEQMLGYRSGIFWGRLHDPGLLLGLPTSDELEDIEPDKTPKTTKLPENIGSGMSIYETEPKKEPETIVPPRYEAVIAAFGPYGVTEKDLSSRSGRSKESWDDATYADFTAVIKELKKGAPRHDFFQSMDDHAKACVRLNELAEDNKNIVDKLLAGRNPDHMTAEEVWGVIDGVEDGVK